ncbi:MAG: GH92 family glycosyl hydrolase [Bacteroidales bacterium]|nr:GH92 family glycosyl hydrolase [Bacteroidales bacterium]
MRKSLTAITLLALIVTGCGKKTLTSYVDPLIGTGGHGHTTPAAIVPFGMIQPGPDTRLGGWDGCSGYHYSDDTVYGFSHTHLSGTGVEDYCDLLLMPFTKTRLELDEMLADSNGIRDYCKSDFTHRNEHAVAGYYSVMLGRDGTIVELTADRRVAYHSYTFDGKGLRAVAIDLRHRDQLLSGSISLDPNGLVVGHRHSNSWNPNQQLYFAISSDTKIVGLEYAADSAQAVIIFPDNTLIANLKVAISGVDIEGAKRNLAAAEHSSFDAARRAADAEWEKALGKIEVEGGTPDQRKIFYSALYHCMTSPYLWSDADGRYRGTDGQIHTADSGHEVYTVFSLWDTYRALHPLLTLIDSRRTADFIYTMRQHWRQGGELTMWELAGHETHCMIGYHAAPVILESGLADSELLEAMVATSNRTEAHRRYAIDGYMSSEVDNESVSKTLEYAYDDWCIAQCAKRLGNDSLYNIYMSRADSWQNVMDSSGFMHARQNGGFVSPFDPTEVNNHYTEANAWQYSTYVPHNIEGWKARLGKVRARALLDTLFYGSSTITGRNQSDITGLIGQYAHGNEPSHHAAYLYAWFEPQKVGELVHLILSQMYSTAPDGLCGNEDCGQMSAWYVLSACGLYPVCPGSGQWVTVEPLFDRATIHTDGGDIVSSRSELRYGNASVPMANGKVVRLHTPASRNNCQPQAAKPSTAAPWFGAANRRFDRKAVVDLYCIDRDAKIYYTLNGSIPDNTSTLYTRPFEVASDCTVQAVAYTPAGGRSHVVSQQLNRFVADKTVAYNTHPAPQYFDGGETGLVDRLHATSNYLIGGWQGWQEDMDVTIDLLKTRNVSTVELCCLENTRSWILLPRFVGIDYSPDGRQWRPFGIQPLRREPDHTGTPTIHTITIDGQARVRYLRVRARNYGPLPDWHPSAGGQAWIFVDEITIK